MITHNKYELYSSLFKKAEERLSDFGMTITIDSLETYFQHLRDLVYGPNDEGINDPSKADYIYLKLPSADEEGHFIIDANTRTIDTKNFKGVLSVQGDEIAEIVFFEIDRYFDATDLNQMDIVIEWQYHAGKNTISSYTPAFIKYIENDKLIFGWPITSEVTAAAGALEFAVKFYKTDNGKTLYSFKTLSTKMNIGTGLQVDTSMPVDDPTKTIMARLINSTPDGELSVEAPWFVWTNKDISPIGEITEPIYLYALASAKKGSLNYQWLLNGEAIGDRETWIPANAYYPVLNRYTDIYTYYYKSGKDYVPTTITTDNSFTEANGKYGDLYVNCVAYELNSTNIKAGTYQIDCMASLAGEKAYVSGDPVGSNLNELPQWIVIGPDAIVIDEAVWPSEILKNTELTITGTGLNVNKTQYKWFYKLALDSEPELVSTNSRYSPTKEGYYYVVVTNVVNNTEASDTTPECLVLEPIADIYEIKTRETNGAREAYLMLDSNTERPLNNHETIIYEWFKGASSEGKEPIYTGSIYNGELDMDSRYCIKATITKGSSLLLTTTHENEI